MRTYYPQTALLQHPKLGEIRLDANLRGITRLGFSLPAASADRNSASRIVSAPESLAQVCRELLDYLSGQRVQFSLQPDWQSLGGFQARVLEATWRIPYGDVLTYGQLASQLGSSGAARAVGAALANNPMPLIIPCHRVVGADGSLHGFSAPGGLRTKAWLLKLEGHILRPGDPPRLMKENNGNFS
jgi:methylated-DNA-[protein]-cysteine S-methyltransferase